MKLSPHRLAARAALQGALAVALWVNVGAKAATSPTLDAVYDAAQKGHLEQAQEIMRIVLRAHPDSAKAHYVEAELLGLEGRNDAAHDELDTAEHLAPGLPFARRDAVDKLRREIETPAALRRPMLNAGALAPGGERNARGATSVVWQTLLAIACGALVAWALMALGRPARKPAHAGAGLPQRSEIDPRGDGSAADAALDGPEPGVARAGSRESGGVGAGQSL